ncbi:MAG: condensation domain-containing protein [Actinomycetota bacterium]
MRVRVLYKGYELDFPSYPGEQEILLAFERFERAVRSCMHGQGTSPIPRAMPGEELPVSFIQEALWLQEQLHPGSAAYNLPAAVRLSGDLDVVALERSLTEVVRRHESLRTRFPLVNGRLIQVVTPPQPLTLSSVDFSHLDSEMREIAVADAAGREAGEAFNLEEGPLLRCKLLKVSADEHIILLTIHHIVFDAWSAGILVRELATHYATYSTGGVPGLPELPLQYGDFAKWQREQLNGERLRSMLDYWKEHLAGAPHFLQVPTDFPRPQRLAPEGNRHFFHLTPELTASLKLLAGQEGVTLFTLLLATFQVLLMKYSRQDDVVVGIPVAGRVRPELENLIGCFINTLALRSRVKPQSCFREFLHVVQDAVYRMFSFQELPFEKVIQTLAPERHPGYTPIYQVLFDFVNNPPAPVQLPSLTLSPVAANSQSTKMDLVVDMWATDAELAGQIEYRTSLFQSDTIKLLARSFQVLLENVVANPGVRVADLEIRTEVERQQELVATTRQQKLNPLKIASIRPKAIKL